MGKKWVDPFFMAWRDCHLNRDMSNLYCSIQGNSHYFRGAILRNQILVMLKNRLFGTLVNNDPKNLQMSVVPRLKYHKFVA